MFQGTGALAFNATFYLQNNPDVFLAIQNGTFQGSALDHFIAFGQFEGRDPNQFFDTDYYLGENPDVLTAIADPANPSVTSAFQHFVMFGADEGVVRAPSAAFASFNAETYLAQNPDLQAAFANVPAADLPDVLFAHFVEFGVNENRPGTGVTLPEGGAPGSTIALTTGIDTLTGTSGNDVFVGVIDGTANTIQTGDTINGGAGTDTLRIVATADGNTGVISLTNVERVEVQAIAATTDVTVNLANSTGVQTLASKGSDGNVVFNGVNAAAAIALTNTSGNLTANYAAGVASPAAGQNVSLNNVDGSIVTVNNATTFNVAATGENSVALASGADVTTLNISGNGSLEITGTVASTVATVNASANSGGVDLDLSATTKDLTVTGGSGDDRFVFGTIGAKDVVNGGAGFDTVVVDAADYTAATAAAPFNGLTAIERVEFDGSGAVKLDGDTFTNASISNLLFNNVGTAGAGAIDAEVLNAGSARTYEFGNTFAGDASFQLKAAAAELNIALLGEEGDGVANGVEVGELNVSYVAATAATAVTTVNLVSSGELTSTETNAITGGIAVREGSTIVITGDADLTLGATRAVAVSGAPAGTVLPEGFTIDASDFTGDLTVAASTVQEEFILGAGVDTVVFAGGTSGNVETVATVSTLVDIDVITGFTAGAGGDVLQFGSATAGADYDALSAAELSAIGSLGTLLDAANAALSVTTAGDWSAFAFQGETYAIFNAAAPGAGAEAFDDAADVIVQLSGVAVADLTADNFVA